MSARTRQPGQILVIFAGGLMAMMLIAALVIDLGFVFMAKRQAQNAADPGAIAAARFIRPTVDRAAMRVAACFYARQNGFFAADTSCSDGSDPTGARLIVNYPPSSGAGSFAGRPGFVEVVVHRPHESFLAGLVGLARFNVASSAVAAFSAGDSNSNSLIALDPGGCGGISAGGVSGGAQVTITPTINPATGLPFDGGYVHVNSTCGAIPSQNGVCGNGEGSGALRVDGGASLTAPHVYVSGTCVVNSATFNAPLTEGAVQIGDPLAELAPPPFGPPGRCGVGGALTAPTGSAAGGCTFNNSSGTVELQPGTYYGGWRITGNNVRLRLAPGIYHLAGGGISLTGGGTIESVDSVTGTVAPILIFSTDNPAGCAGLSAQVCRQQEIDFNASGTLRVRGIDSGPYKGIVLWQDGNGSNPTAQVRVGGQAKLEIGGTIYAPKALVTLFGGSTGTGIAAVQIIAWQFNLTGSVALSMPYDPRQLYQFDQKGLVH
jgi:Putative Flp pilus-assembly TadE/G-like